MFKINQLQLVSHKKEYKEHFSALNNVWLKRYFAVEPIDEKIFADGEGYMIEKGGHIFFAVLERSVAGPSALTKLEDGAFELSKIAVAEILQGQQFGNKILHFRVAPAIALGAQKIILYSNTRLQPAIHLYRKFGFQEVPLGKVDYKRANIKMEISLNN